MAYDEVSNNSEILHENNRLRIANAKLNEDLLQTEISMHEWRSKRDEAVIAYNDLILDIVSDIPFTADIGGERHITIKDHLHQMQKALSVLEEIKDYCEKCKKCVETGDEVILYTVIKKVNEVLGDESDKNIG